MNPYWREPLNCITSTGMNRNWRTPSHAWLDYHNIETNNILFFLSGIIQLWANSNQTIKFMPHQQWLKCPPFTKWNKSNQEMTSVMGILWLPPLKRDNSWQSNKTYSMTVRPGRNIEPKQRPSSMGSRTLSWCRPCHCSRTRLANCAPHSFSHTPCTNSYLMICRRI